MKISPATLLEILNIQRTVVLEECSKNYVDLVKGYAETIQEQFPTFETMQLPKRAKRDTIVKLRPELIKQEYDNELFDLNVGREFARINKAKKDLEISFEFFRRKRRPVSSLALKNDLRCADFKRLKGLEHLEFFCSVCAELPFGSTIESCRHDFGEHCFISNFKSRNLHDDLISYRDLKHVYKTADSVANPP